MKKLFLLSVLLCISLMQALATEWTDVSGVTWTFDQQTYWYDDNGDGVSYSHTYNTITGGTNYGDEVTVPQTVYDDENPVSDVLEVTYNNSSGISNGQYTGTLADGTVLGFHLETNNSYAYFCGAITTATSIVVPERISLNGSKYNVAFFGYGGTIDFDEAPNVTSIILPSVLTNIYSSIPSTVTELHLLGTTPPEISNSGLITTSTTVYVPLSALSLYQNYCSNKSNGWNIFIDVKPEGWEPHSYTVTVNRPGTFGNIMLQMVEQWTDVDELTVIGHLNEEDLKLLTRLKQIRKLDLTQTDITVMKGCSSLSLLQEVLLPSTVVEIGSSVFSGCTRLKEINAPNATSIGENAFYDCSSLSTVSLPAATSIGEGAFFRCSSLSTVSLPAATSIAEYAFSQCSSLSTVILPAATSIAENAFYDCSSLRTVSLPAATSIGENAFYDCSSLRTVSLPAATSIGEYAFSQCSRLSTVSLPAATSIGGHAFNDCYNLSTVSLPAATSIGEGAFSYCSYLRTVSLPACLESLKDAAFYGCSGLKDVYCRVIAPLTTSAFSGVGGSATLHVPAFSLTAYMLSDSWYSFYKIVPLDETLTELTINNAFTITSFDGLADKIDLTLTQNGQLTISADGTLNIGTFLQQQSTTISSSWDYNTQREVYTDISTLVTDNETKADNVSISMAVPTNRWNFISLPFDANVSEIEYPEGTLWVIRKYSGADRAALTGNTWQNMTNGTVLKAGEGYILHCANEGTNTVEFVFKAVDNAQKNNIFACQDVVKPLATYASEYAHNRSWNLVGNPYPAYFDTHSIEHNGVITVYGNNSNSYYSTNYYTAYSLLDDDYVLRPNEAFFVQCPLDATSMTFKAEGRMHKDSSKENGSSTRAPRRNAAINNNRQVYNFTLTNGDYTDKARLVVNPDAKMDYEISCDASKFMSDDPAIPQLYVCDNSIRYAIDERPLGNGIIALGAHFGQTGNYTIALNTKAVAPAAIILTDHETGSKANLCDEAYTFTAQAGTNESRFTLHIGGDATGINEVVNSKSSNGKVLYDLQGRQVSDQQQKGIYIVKQNGKSRKALK